MISPHQACVQSIKKTKKTNIQNNKKTNIQNNIMKNKNQLESENELKIDANYSNIIHDGK